MLGGRKASGIEPLAALGALSVLVLTVSQNATGESMSGGGCINVHPDILKVQPGPGTVRIEWMLMSHLRSVTGYLVMYKSSCNSKYHTKIVGNVNATTIEGLYSHSNYTLRMTVVCNSTPSNTFTPLRIFTTPDQSVMVAPDNVSVVALNVSTAAMRWDALDPCDWNGDPVEYVVAVTDLTAGMEVRRKVSWRHQAVYLVLGRGRSYDISVSAVNKVGEGPPSTPITFTVPGLDAGVDTTVIVGMAVGIVILFLLLILILSALYIVVVCVKHKKTIRHCKSGSSNDVEIELKGVHSHFDNVKLEPNPAYEQVSPSKDPAYVEVPPSKDPAYVEVPPSKDPAYVEVPPSKDPAYVEVPPSKDPTDPKPPEEC